MSISQDLRDPSIAGNDPFGMSRFSIRRYSVQQFSLIVLVNVLLATLAVTAILWGNLALISLSVAAMVVVWGMTALVVWVGLRAIAVEIWIRRLGVGDFEYHIEPRGNDEVAKMCQALEKLRIRSIEVVRLQLVEKLSAELADSNADLATKNEELYQALVQFREAQDQIVAQQKLRELIDLSTGVAHEIRNPLNFVQNFCDGSAELLDELMESLSRAERDEDEIHDISSELRANMDHIRRNVGRADRVLDGMINLGACHGAWQEIGLNLLVRQSVQAAKDSWVATSGGGIPVVELREAPGNPQCTVVPEGIALAVMSLIQNACEAVVATANPGSAIGVSVSSDGEEARIVFRDAGVGMPPEVLEKAMIPFFTTKTGDQQGAGLGLCQASEVARSHGGSVTLESALGQGTTATLILKIRPPMAQVADTDC